MKELLRIKEMYGNDSTKATILFNLTICQVCKNQAFCFAGSKQKVVEAPQEQAPTQGMHGRWAKKVLFHSCTKTVYPILPPKVLW